MPQAHHIASLAIDVGVAGLLHANIVAAVDRGAAILAALVDVGAPLAGRLGDSVGVSDLGTGGQAEEAE